MRIVEIIPQLGSGGAERFVVDLSNELTEAGHEVILIVFHPLDKEGFFQDELNPAIRVINLNKSVGLSFSTYYRLSKILFSLRPDVIHTHLGAINYILPTAVLLRRSVFFHTVHSDAALETETAAGKWIRKFLYALKRVCPVTISAESRKSFRQFYGIDAPLILNGRNVPSDIKISDSVLTEFKNIRKSANTKVFVNIAHIDRNKRQDIIARCVNRLSVEGYDVALVLIGRNLNNEVYSRIDSIGSPVIHYIGLRHNPLEYLAMADAFCLASEREGFPISLIEALGAGTVSICTPVGGIIDVVEDGENGLLSTDISEEAYYNALKRFLAISSDEKARMAKNAKSSYAKYSMTECAQNYDLLFHGKLIES